MKRNNVLMVMVALIQALSLTAGAGEFFFKDGDKVVVMGDSITEQHLYSNYLEAWTLTRFPTWKITFHNVGIGGDTSRGGNGRFVRDVAEYKPTVLTVDFGMNDGGYRAFDRPLFDNYMGGLAGIAKQAKEANLRVAWITPSPVEKNEDGPAIEGYNRTLEKFSEGVKKVAVENGGLFIDQFHPCVAVEDKARAAKPSNRVGGGDAVHFGPPGQAVMASAILKGMSFPTLVSAVEIDASGKIGKSDNCKVTEATVTSGGIKFTRLDQALPFFPAEATAILAWSPVLEEMNQYTLKVTGLAGGKYDVALGGKTVAQYTNVQLAAGVNLAGAALKAGPVADQVQAIWSAIKEKNQFNHDKIYRGLILSNSGDKAKIDSLRAEVAKKDAEIQKLRVIAPHTVEIIPAKQPAAPKAKKVVFLAGGASHGRGEHAWPDGAKLLKRCLDTSANVKGVASEVYLNGWPTDPAVLDDAATIVLLSDGDGGHPLFKDKAREEKINSLMARGVGLVCIHYAVDPPDQGEEPLLRWIGGIYKTGYSTNPTNDVKLSPATPDHPIARGLKPFRMRDEIYYRIWFGKGEGTGSATPIATITLAQEPKPQIVAWAIQRKDGGRGFGFTGCHFHKLWGIEGFRGLVLNAIAWTAKIEVPKEGVQSTVPSEMLEESSL